MSRPSESDSRRDMGLTAYQADIARLDPNASELVRRSVAVGPPLGDPDQVLLRAIDRVVDVFTVEWERMVCERPDLLSRIGTTPESTGGGLDMGLQFSRAITWRCIGYPTPTPNRVEAYRAAQERRWALTISGVPAGEQVTSGFLSEGATATYLIPQSAMVVGLLADMQSTLPGNTAGAASAEAAYELAEACLTLDGLRGLAVDDRLEEIRGAFQAELSRHGLDWNAQALEAYPSVWTTPMEKSISTLGCHPLQAPHDGFVADATDVGAVIGYVGNRAPVVSPDDATSFAAAIMLQIITSAAPEPETFAAAMILHATMDLDARAIWTPRLLTKMASVGEVGPYLSILDGVAKAEVADRRLSGTGRRLAAGALRLAQATHHQVAQTPESISRLGELARRSASTLSQVGAAPLPESLVESLTK